MSNPWDWRDYEQKKYDGIRKYTKEEVGAMYEVLSWTLNQAKDAGKDIEPFVWAIENWHKKMYDMPHRHSQSIIGPYCFACHCNIPEERWND